MAWKTEEVKHGSHKGDYAVMTDQPNNRWWIVGFFRHNKYQEAKDYENKMKKLLGGKTNV